jgi:hypothetical protein
MRRGAQLAPLALSIVSIMSIVSTLIAARWQLWAWQCRGRRHVAVQQDTGES